MSTKGNEISRKKSHHKIAGVVLPAQGQAFRPVVEDDCLRKIDEVNAKFETKFKEPYDVVHGDSLEARAFYLQLVG